MTRIGKANLARCPKCGKVVFIDYERKNEAEKAKPVSRLRPLCYQD
jgi:hypothetical protein